MATAEIPLPDSVLAALRAATADAHSDLAALGVVEEPATGSLPSISSLAEAMGAVSVVEGSALGGLLLAKAVERSLGPDVPRRYLSLRGDGTAARWREFVTSLERWGARAPAPGRAIACEAARGTFAAYAAAFAAEGAFV